MATPPTPLANISPEVPGAPPPKKNQNVLIWILSGCGTVLVLLVLVGVFAFRSFVKNNVHVGPNGEVDVKVGGMTMRGGKPRDLGIPVYPGADAAHATGMDMTVPLPKHDPLALSMAIYSTKDSEKTVDDWYHENLRPDFIRLEPGQRPTVVGGKSFVLPIEAGAIAYTCTRDDIEYAVTLNSLLGNTQIKLMRSNNPVVNQPQ